MELRHLRYFVAVAEEENITRAAARLHVSQPPLTRQIQEMEQEIGVSLFTRTAKSIHLNDAGRKFLREARSVLARVESAVTSLRSRNKGRIESLNVAYASAPTTSLLTPILRTFKKRAPDVRLTLHDTSTTEMIGGLRSGKFHVALTLLSSRTPPRGFVFEPLREDQIVLCVPQDHPLARRRRVGVRDLIGLPFAVLAEEKYPDHHEMLRMALGPVARRLHVVEECDGGASFLTAVESGRAVGVASMGVEHTAGCGVRLIPLRPVPPPLVVGVLHRAKALPTFAQMFVGIARTFSDVT